MPVQFHAAFAPKKSSVITSGGVSFGGRNFNVLGFISLLCFFVAAGAAITLFFYKGHLINTLAEKDALLVSARRSLEPAFIETMVRLNKRIEAGKKLLVQHRTLSPLFDILEKKTLESVRFKDFSFGVKGTRGTLSMTGEGKNFNTVALQSDTFGSEARFINPVFSDFSLNERGEVLFKFAAELAPALLNYGEEVIAPRSLEGEEVESQTL